MPQDVRDALLKANILEVRMNASGKAVVIAQIDNVAGGPFDIRSLMLEEARWVNLGHDQRKTMDEAQEVATLVLSR